MNIDILAEKLANSQRETHTNPNKGNIVIILNELQKVVFPTYYAKEKPNASDYIESLETIKSLLYLQINRAFKAISVSEDSKAEEIVDYLLDSLPSIRETLLKDVEAGYNGDPAAKSFDDIILSYPGLYAIFVYRIAHVLYTKNVPLIPRMMTEHAHMITGIDINAGATIGEYFFIDHGTGVVIGETTIIGNKVKLYQGVTLGALSTRKGQQLSGVKRHPTIGNNVTIYSNASVLGGETVIGDNSIIGGGAFITKSVPSYAKVFLKNQELVIEDQNENIFEI